MQILATLLTIVILALGVIFMTFLALLAFCGGKNASR